MELLVLNPGKSQTNWDELAPPVLALTQFYSLLSLLGQLHVVHSACPSPHLPRQLQSIYLMDVMKCVTVTSTPACPRLLSPLQLPPVRTPTPPAAFSVAAVAISLPKQQQGRSLRVLCCLTPILVGCRYSQYAGIRTDPLLSLLTPSQ